MRSKTLITILFYFYYHMHYKIGALEQPNIVIILADDVGWNDVGFHGSNQIPTPNIDALAYNGVILNRFYTQHTCTPSRTALLTGQYPMRLGMQGIPIIAGENRHLPLDVPTLPEKLKQLGYTNYLIGKWHLGAAYKNVTPTSRGFDYHFGYWHGYIGYFNHYAKGNDMTGLDMHENYEPNWSTYGQYATELFTQKAEEVLGTHDKNKPFFLMVSHLAGHTGKDGSALEVPNEDEVHQKFNYIKDKKRRMYAGIIDLLDKSVGAIISSLSKNGHLENTIVLFMSDNGAQTVGVHENWGSNWPLRGLKFSMHDGGVRNVALLYSSRLQNKGTINEQLMHITDLLPTFYTAAGGDIRDLGAIDGINQWSVLIDDIPTNRSEILLNIDELENSAALIGENGRYKLVNGSSGYDVAYGDYYGEDGRCDINPSYNTAEILKSDVNTALQGELTHEKILQLRKQVDLGLNCRKQVELNGALKNCRDFCLFDLLDDPCETRNIAKEFPLITEALSKKLTEYWMQLRPQPKAYVDSSANPIYFNNTWYTWLER